MNEPSNLPDPNPNDGNDDRRANRKEDGYGKAERIRQLHKVCKLLSIEELSTTTARSATSTLTTASAHGIQKVLAALATSMVVLAFVFGWLIFHPAIREVPDRRLGADYRRCEATDLVHTPKSGQLYLSTKGDGVHRLDVRTGFLRQHTFESTGGQLLSDDVLQLEYDGHRAVYFLCDRDGARGLCRLSLSKDRWRTLMGVSRFPELTDESNLPSVTGVARGQNCLWIATDRCGIGLYNPENHVWESILRTGPERLLSDEVADLLQTPRATFGLREDDAIPSDPTMWIATSAGINRVVGDQWQRFEHPEHLVGSEVRRLFFNKRKLWYTTAAGGVGTFDGSCWQTVVDESQWKRHCDADVVALAYAPDRAELWLVSKAGDVGRYHLTNHKWTSFDAPTGNLRVEALACRDSGQSVELMAATTKGLLRLDPESGNWSTLGLPDHSLSLVDAGAELTAVVAKPDDRQPDATAHALSVDGRISTLVGTGSAKLGSQGVLTATVDQDKHLLVATESGISSYDPASHQWLVDVKQHEGENEPRGPIRDLVAGPTGVHALTSSGGVDFWDGTSEQMSALTGGGRFPSNLASVVAVTRDRHGLLWVATAEKLYRYDGNTRHWTPVPDCPSGIQSLEAARDGVWILAEGTAHFTDGTSTKPLEEFSDKLVRLFASPEFAGALVMSDTGRVHQLFNVQRHELLVGDPVNSLDLASISAVGVVGNRLFLGGPNSHIYDAAHRDWQAVDIPGVEQVVSAFDRLWLRTETGAIYRLAPSDDVPVDVSLEVPILWLDGQPKRLVALGNDGRVSQISNSKRWSAVKTPAFGPSADALGSDAVVLAEDDNLYLAGGSNGQLHRFSWTAQSWQAVPGDNGAPLKGITQLAAGAGHIFALVGGTGSLYSLSANTSVPRKETVAGVRQVRAVGDSVVLTDSQGAVHQFSDGRWRPVLGRTPESLPAGTIFKHAAQTKHGLLLAGTNCAAVLDPSMANWKPVHGTTSIDQLISDPRGESAWALSGTRDLTRLTIDSSGALAWTPVRFDKTRSAVTSVSLGSEQADEQAWGCLDDGSLHRIQGTTAHLWHRPTIAPQGPADVVGIAIAADRFLVAFRGGSLQYCEPGLLGWSSAEAPSVQVISQFLPTGPVDKPEAYWLLDGDGCLHWARTTIPLKWEQIATGVEDICVAGRDLIAASSSRAELTRFDMTGQPSILFGPSRVTNELGEIVAAGEIAVDHDHAVLVLSDGDQLQAYDPRLRSFNGHTRGLRELLPVRCGLVGRDQQGSLHRVTRKADEIAVAPIDGPSEIAQLATSENDDRVVALSSDGSLWLLAPDEHLPTQLTAQLPKTARASQIRSIEAVEHRLFVALEDGTLCSYDSVKHKWSRVPNVTSVKQVCSVGGCLWVEANCDNKPSLYRIDCGDKIGSPVLVLPGLLDWAPTSKGVLARFRNGVSIRSCYLGAKGDPLELTADRTLGPEADTVVGAVSTQLGVWMRTSEQALWHYSSSARRWSRSKLPTGIQADTLVLDAARPLIHTEDRSLLLGYQTKESEAWRFAPVATGVTAFDAAGSRLAYITADRLVVGDLNAKSPATIRELVFPSAWSEESSAPRTMTGIAETLWLADTKGSIASYDFTQRRWKRQPNAPWPVDRFHQVGGRTLIVGPDLRLAILANGAWNSTSRASTSWKDSKGEYVIDVNQRLHAAVTDEPPASESTPAEPASADGSSIDSITSDTDAADAPRSIGSSPARVHAADGLAWIEMLDGSLWCYRELERRLTCSVAAPSGNTTRFGLVSAGRDTYFVTAHEGKIGKLEAGRWSPRWLDLPEHVEVKFVRCLEDQLLLIGDGEAVTVRGDTVEYIDDADQLDSLRRGATVPDTTRHLTAGRWRLVSDTGASSLRLEWQIGLAWYNAHLDPDAGQLGWDMAVAGLSQSDRVVIATEAGVAVYQPGAAGPPTALYPIPLNNGQPLKLAIWTDGDSLLVGSADGRLWQLATPDPAGPDVLEAIAPPDSIWTVTESEGKVELAIQLGPDGAESLPVSIDAKGQLGIDRAISIAWLADSLLVATPDAVLQYSCDLNTLEAVHRHRAAMLRAVPMRSRVLMRVGKDEILAFDGAAWEPATSEAFNAAILASELLDREGASQPIHLRVDLGPEVGSCEIPYSDRGFAHDVPIDAEWGSSRTCDGRFVYTATSIGLVVEDQNGQITAIRSMNSSPSRLAWHAIDSASPSLYVLDNKDVVYKLGEDGLAATKLSASLFETGKRIHFLGTEYRWSISEDGTEATIEPTTPGAGEVLVLDLAKGGVRRDCFTSIALAGGAVWAAAGSTVQRFPFDAAEVWTAFCLGDSDAAAGAVVLRSDTRGLVAELDGHAYRLSATADPVLLSEDEQAAPPATDLCTGSHWNVFNRGGRTYVYYRRTQGPWIHLGFQSDFGMVVDSPRKVLAAGGFVVFDTFAGLFMARDPAPGECIRLDTMVPLEVEGFDRAPVVEQFQCSTSGGVWARIGDTWYQLNVAEKKWVSCDPLPTTVSDEFYCLCDASLGKWGRRDDTLRLLQVTSSGTAESVLGPSGRFDGGFVLAAMQEGQTLWTLTRGGLRRLDHKTRGFNGMADLGHIEAKNGGFRKVDGQWFLEIAGAHDRSVFHLEKGVWQPVDSTDDPTTRPELIGTGRLRAVRDQAAATLAFELTPRPNDDTWEPVTWLPDQSRFDFQVHDDAAAADGHLHGQTRAGLATWRLAAKPELLDLERDLTEIRISADRSCVLCRNGQGGFKSFAQSTGWSDFHMPEAETDVVAQSSRWRYRAAVGTRSRLEIRVDDKWIDVALSPSGDFDFRCPKRLALGPDGTVWTASGNMLVQYSPTQSQPWLVTQLLRPKDFVPDSTDGFTDLLVIEGRPHVRVGDKFFTLNDVNDWSVATTDPAEHARRCLGADGDWSWQRADDGRLQLNRRLADGDSRPWTFHAESKRFNTDTVHDVAFDSNMLWLATAGGLVGLDKTDGHTKRLLNPGTDSWQRFALDRVADRLLLATSATGVGAVSVEPPPGADGIGPPVPEIEANTVFRAAYHDAEWHWELGGRAAVRWRSITTGLAAGRFTHDSYRAMAGHGADLWLLSPAAVVRVQASSERLPVVDAVALPDGIEPVDIIAAANQQIVLVARDGHAYRLNPDGDAAADRWKPTEEVPARRVLVDTEFWTWTRSPGSRLKVCLKASDTSELDPVLESNGRFAFDHVSAVLVDGADVWLAGPHGIVRQQATGGAINHWYRYGTKASESEPLGAIVELGRFNNRGDSVPSCGATAKLQAATLFARAEDGRVWSFNPTSPGSWIAVEASPWKSPHGRRLIRTRSVEATLLNDGQIQLGYRDAQPLRPGADSFPPALSQGRFLADIVRSVAFLDGTTYMATPAGVLELDADGSRRRLWALGTGDRSADNEQHLALIIPKKDAALHFVHGPDSVLRFNSPQDIWEAVSVDDDFRDSADLLFENSLWSWSRWGDTIHVRLLKAQPTSESWPLFVDGRFSFDVLKQFRIANDYLWATTAGGIVQFDPSDMTVLSIDRVATDADTLKEVSMNDAEHFSRQTPLTVYGDRYHFTRRRDGWVRELGGRPATGLDPVYRDGRLGWKLGHLSHQSEAGLEVQFYRGEVQSGRYELLSHISHERFRKVTAGDGRLWICLDRGLYCLDPR